MRSWSNARGEGTLFSIDLLDEDGSEVKGTFFKADANKWYDQLQEGQVCLGVVWCAVLRCATCTACDLRLLCVWFLGPCSPLDLGLSCQACRECASVWFGFELEIAPRFEQRRSLLRLETLGLWNCCSGIGLLFSYLVCESGDWETTQDNEIMDGKSGKRSRLFFCGSRQVAPLHLNFWRRSLPKSLKSNCLDYSTADVEDPRVTVSA